MNPAPASRGALTARLLLLVGLIVTGLTAWRESGSDLSGRLREREKNRPVIGLLTARFGGQGRVVPPALYALVYGPGDANLDLVLIPSSARVLEADYPRTFADVYGDAYAPQGDIAAASAAMTQEAEKLLAASPAYRGDRVFRLDLTLPANARPAFPREMRRLLIAWRDDPFFWLHWPACVAETLSRSGASPALYDALLLSRELRRLDPHRIHLSRLPDDGMVPAFLERILSRGPSWTQRRRPSETVTVEVLNACDEAGVALRATKILRSKRFDVIHFGNARAHERSSRVVDRIGLPGGAEAVARALGCPEDSVITSMEEKPHTSVMIVLGRDFAQCGKLLQ